MGQAQLSEWIVFNLSLASLILPYSAPRTWRNCRSEMRPCAARIFRLIVPVCHPSNTWWSGSYHRNALIYRH